MNHMIRFISAITLVLELIFCIGGFSHFCDEVPDKDNKEGFILEHDLIVQFILLVALPALAVVLLA